jgi:outer membrane protein TolC
MPDLIRAALQNRPELGAQAATIGAAESRYKEEWYRPLLPTLFLGFSGGAFGGGSNLTGVELGGFRGRTDFDVMSYWTLENFGIGNNARQKQRLAQIGEAVAEQSRRIAAIRSEVSAAYAAVSAARLQVDITTRQLASAKEGFREDFLRIRETVGRPLEAVNSLQLLNRARVDRIRAVTEYNKAEFRLFVSLGSPPPLGDSASNPVAPAPIASPPLPCLSPAVEAAVRFGPGPVPPVVPPRFCIPGQDGPTSASR